MQGSGQPGLLPGSAGYQALLYHVQAGQYPGSGQANMAPRLALVQGGARPTAMNAAALAAAAAASGAGFRPPAAPMSMSMLLKGPVRKAIGGQQKGRKHCNCKNSRCLKLYCECFASGRYCDNCNCVSCFNNKESESVRQSAVEAILERNPNAFRPKIQTAEGDTHPQSIRNAPDGTVRHTKGCNCKKSACLKKYCECFQGGIFCTEVCKCVDCKNYDGSEARAQVLSVQEPFNLHQLHQAAAQSTFKRSHMQMGPTAAAQQPTSAGLLQAQNAYQQLAAAGGQVAPSMQQLQALSAPQQQAAAVVPMQAGPTGLAAPAGQPSLAQPQQPSRHPLLDVVHDLVKPELIEELGQLLVLVAKEEADKQQQLQQQQQQPAEQQQQQQQQQHSLGNGVTPKIEDATPSAAGNTATTLPQQPDAKVEGSSSPADVKGTEGSDQKPVAVQKDVVVDADGDSVMQEAETQQPQQQDDRQHSSDTAAEQQETVSDGYAAQEAVVLQEFNAILQRIVAQAEKKSSSLAAAAAAAAAEAPSATAASTATYDAQEQQLQQQLTLPVSQQLQQQLPQFSVQQQLPQQFLQQQQVQQPRPLRQPVLAIPQQAMVLPAGNNLALAQLQQASRQAAFLQAASGAGQPMAAFPSGVGVAMPGLRPMGFGMQQMVQVMAQDGSVHQIPASSLMQLQLAAAAQAHHAAQPIQAAAQPVLQQLPQQAPAVAAVSGTANGPTAAAPGLGVSLLSLLNGTSTSSAPDSH